MDPWALRNSALKKRIAGMLFENSHLRNAACIHALCQSEVLSVRRYGLKNPICVIPNGVDLPSMASPNDTGEKQDGRTLLYLGRLHPKKGLQNLLKAWAHARNDDMNSSKEWKLSIVGWNQVGHEEQLKKLVDELAIDGSVIFPGPKFGEEREKAYLNADAFILPSYSEGLPMTVLEAWAHGLPVLMTAECNLPEGFHEEAAIKIEPNRDSIIKGLEILFTMGGVELNTMGINGRKLVAERFSWSRVAIDMKSVYDWILGGGSPPNCIITD